MASWNDTVQKHTQGTTSLPATLEIINPRNHKHDVRQFNGRDSCKSALGSAAGPPRQVATQDRLRDGPLETAPPTIVSISEGGQRQSEGPL